MTATEPDPVTDRREREATASPLVPLARVRAALEAAARTADPDELPGLDRAARVVASLGGRLLAPPPPAP